MKAIDDSDLLPANAPVEDWANLGSLVGPLSHELRNELNTIGLQVRILQHRLPADQHPLLQVIQRALSNSKEMLDWLRVMREPLENTSGSVDLARTLKAELQRWSDRNSGQQVAKTIEVWLPASIDVPIKIKCPFETQRLLMLRLRQALCLGQARELDVKVDVRPIGGDFEVCFSLMSGLDDLPGGERFDIFTILEPLAALEEFQCESIAERVGISATGNLIHDSAGSEMSLLIRESTS